jgi:hypothetical protein
MMNLMRFGLSKPTKQSLVIKLGKDIQKWDKSNEKKMGNISRIFFGKLEVLRLG